MVQQVRVRHFLLVVVATVVAFAASVYLYIQNLTAHASEPLAVADNQCHDPAAKAENPNKMLFISCGGFLE